MITVSSRAGDHQGWGLTMSASSRQQKLCDRISGIRMEILHWPGNNASEGSLAATAFATLETEGYGQFVGSIQRAFPHDVINRSGLDPRAVVLVLQYWHGIIHQLSLKCS